MTARIYPLPTMVKSCCNCPGFRVRWSASYTPIALVRKMVCSVFNMPITTEICRKAMDGEFPSFCKLEVVK